MLRWFLPAILSGIAAVAVCLPLRWAAAWVLPDNIKTIAPDLKMHGTIWRGTLSGLPLFGTANVNISPAARQIEFEGGDGRNYVSGSLSPSVAKALDLRVNFADVPFTDGRLKGLRGDFMAEISEMQFAENVCQSAAGSASTDVLQRNGGTIQWTGPELSGPVRCEDGAVIVDMSGKDAQQNINASIKIMPNGTYRAELKVRTKRPEADAVLPLFGFSRSGQSFVLTEQGKWR